MTAIRKGISLAIVAAALATLPAGAQVPSSAGPKYLDIGGGARLAYAESGSGTPVVFVHGALGEYAGWDGHREALAASGYRGIAISQRYHGPDPWDKNWPPYGVQTHADDLLSFIRALGAGPVHLVAWSYGGHVVLTAARREPGLVKSAFLFEPSVPSYVTDDAAMKELAADRAVLFGPVAKALKDGNNEQAARELIDGVGERRGYLDDSPPAFKQMILANARTMPPLFGAPPPPPISCEELGQMRIPVAIARGEAVRPFFRVIADAASACMPQAKRIIAPKQKHMWPGEDVAGFSRELVAFLKAQDQR